MNPDPGLTITAPDRVLIHLMDFRHHADDRDFPLAITQKGISEATGLRLTHVPRTLKALEDRGLVSSVKGHVIEERRRYKVYFLTDTGMTETKAILRFLMNEEINGRKVGDILGDGKGPLLPMLMELAGEAAIQPKGKRQVAGLVPNIEGFINRQHELEELGNMLDDPKNRVIAIYGSQGYGTSALAAEFVCNHAKAWSVAWVDARKNLDDLVDSLAKTASLIIPDITLDPRQPKRLAQQMDGKNIILVLDGYYEASDEVVEFLAGLVCALKQANGLKLLVTARENTPSYNRFYTIIDQHDGTVGEVHIHGLDMAHCQEFLGTPDIDPEAMKKLFLFTRGKPPTLKLLAKGNEKELRQHTSFSPEEIKLMLFLKGQKSA